ncbi:hypothetical protein CALCODRAFT_152083 [Calocera cornea HHB12733]|uniref:Uncharacterized protein n=1 Tax=Calocera cornea HHB12733 TaxID=1353952 RepID=A0A165CP60_9BASI|nr:hypothetical protein CALCODRAFT_152083 [Calocera cornea HHB12733]
MSTMTISLRIRWVASASLHATMSGPLSRLLRVVWTRSRAPGPAFVACLQCMWHASRSPPALSDMDEDELARSAGAIHLGGRVQYTHTRPSSVPVSCSEVGNRLCSRVPQLRAYPGFLCIARGTELSCTALDTDS